MTNNDRELLLKDLCTRLPYGVKCQIQEDEDIYIGTLRIIEVDDKNGHLLDFIEPISGLNCQVYLSEIKPYLFPLSSMTEEQANELFNLFGISLLDSVGRDYIKINECTGITFFLNKGFDVETHLDKLMNWLNKNHFDYRGLIPMGLAIDCTNLNIY